ncbi:Mediator of RNA polymerase II transcription subunit 19 [Fusarium oxysporum f. sp. albedinis]|nr:Mediator of RNA polymerase II transcription subunit 19 [Fusarium oxysporum f. sp. albedinis]
MIFLSIGGDVTPVKSDSSARGWMGIAHVKEKNLGDDYEDGYDLDQAQDLKSDRTRPSKNPPESCWKAIFRVLFPDWPANLDTPNPYPCPLCLRSQQSALSIRNISFCQFLSRISSIVMGVAHNSIPQLFQAPMQIPGVSYGAMISLTRSQKAQHSRTKKRSTGFDSFGSHQGINISSTLPQFQLQMTLPVAQQPTSNISHHPGSTFAVGNQGMTPDDPWIDFSHDPQHQPQPVREDLVQCDVQPGDYDENEILSMAHF